MPRQRQLDKDAIHRGIGIELFNQRNQIGLGRFGRQLVFKAGHTGFNRLLALVADIDLAGRIIADQHHGQTGLAARLGFERCRSDADAFAQGSGKGLAIDDPGLAHPTWRPT